LLRIEKDMKYGQIAGARQINEFIYRCLEYICEADELKFVKKLREQPHDSHQVMHTLRELIVGAYIGSCGFRVRHEYTIDGRTPDWCILDESLAATGIVESASFHIDQATEMEIRKQIESKKRAFYWRDGNADNIDRLYHVVQHKMQVYRTLAKRLGIPYIVAIYAEIEAAIDFHEELCPCLSDEEFGLFHMYPETSGVLFFEGDSGRYLFSYARNPDALHLIDLPSGVFPHDGV
jgi:hypothetical protein